MYHSMGQEIIMMKFLCNSWAASARQLSRKKKTTNTRAEPHENKNVSGFLAELLSPFAKPHTKTEFSGV